VKRSAVREWRREWSAHPHTNLAAIALGDVVPPSTTLSPFHKHFSGPRDVHTRIIQTITGHGFRGDYYARFVPTEVTACPCGEAPVQTREHILADCPLYERGRHFLRAVSPNISSAILLGTRSGLEALAKFIATSRAFAKSPPEPVDEP
ncbi:unnamed protein product, partial [Peniophora sp. CBMAI 1063]